MEYLLQVGVHTLVTASLYAILALGYNLLYSINRFFDMTFAAYIVFGGYSYFVLSTAGANIGVTLIGVLVSVSIFSYLCERYLYRNLRKRNVSTTALMVASIGVLTIVQGLIGLIFTSDFQVLQSGSTYFNVGPVVFTMVQVVTVLCAASMYIVTYYVLNFTKGGIQFRAIKDNEELARITGIPVEKIRVKAVTLAASFGALAGVLYGLDVNVQPLMGIDLLFKGIVAAVVAGLGSLSFGIAGALFLATAENAAAWFISSEWKEATTFIVLLFVLFIRPSGIIKK